ncbi:diacylglycerol kinase eta-like [Ctenocephalides felis]|uniref:diacylglycerol kinase eta-like n=1 Tax=Ctenocephalides felis TaxID=7515 RepID=UPI000E6E269D|nr:diacylglycerol kinase eta-like [Ctenocephalides felis]
MAETRPEMEDWLSALKAASNRLYYEQGVHDFLSGDHHWYATSHARPTYCNVCRDALSGVTSHGLSCEVCKCKVHKRCAAKAVSNCKWTTLASVGKDIIEDKDGNITMPHQWMEGNLPVSAKCAVCDKTCGSVLRLQDWRCLWCRATVHTACRPAHKVKCPLGPSKVSVVPPTALHSVGSEETWEATRPQGCSPLLVFVNSKSGDNQGVKFLRRFKQLLNPAQVFDLIGSGPGVGLNLFRNFDHFRILICSGDGSVGWVLSEIDRLDLLKQCQVAVLPLGTGNDLARVLGWGASCDDDAHLPQLLERYEKAGTKMLDRWSIMTFERDIAFPKIPNGDTVPSSSCDTTADTPLSPALEQCEACALWHLQTILQADDSAAIHASAELLQRTVQEMLTRVREINAAEEDATEKEQLEVKADLLKTKLDMLIETLNNEEVGSVSLSNTTRGGSGDVEKGAMDKKEKEHLNLTERRARSDSFIEREALHCRADSLKRAMRNVMQHTEIETYRSRSTQQNSTKTTKTTDRHRTTARPRPGSITPTTLASNLLSADVVPAPGERLTSISPLPDQRRDSNISTGFDHLVATLPVPQEFADSRRSSYQQSIQEMEEAAAELVKLFPLCSATHRTEQTTTNESESTTMTGDLPYDEMSFNSNTPSSMPSQEKDDSIATVCTSNKRKLEPPRITVDDASNYESNVLESEAMMIIDTDLINRRDSTASDVLSAMSNEECSVGSDILDKAYTAPQNSDGEDANGHIGHIDSPETSDTTCQNSEALHGESIVDDISSVLGQDLVAAITADQTMTEDSTVFRKDCRANGKVQASGIDNRSDEQKIKYCSLAQFEEGNDIARRSFKRPSCDNTKIVKVMDEKDILNEELEEIASLKQRIQGSKSAKQTYPSVVVEPPSPIIKSDMRIARARKSIGFEGCAESRMESLGVRNDTQRQRSNSDYNPNLLRPDAEHMKFLGCSPAATRRISSGSLFKGNEAAVLAASVTSLYAGSSLGLGLGIPQCHKDDKDEPNRRLPIINPLVQLPTWPHVSSGSGFISKCLLANADALCAAVSPLMDPDETLLEGFYERCVMNNYFGIGIDAKISLDFHHKREEHPEKCRSRAKNYMWYGVLGSKEWLQKTYKNLEQRVQLECDGQRIPLPSLQGIVILNISSFMGGTNFWGGKKEDDCFLAPSFDDKILEVVAVFGSVQMAASRLINLQHHRIAQCQTVQISILGDEGVPIQVDGEAWIQPPGIIRIIHKNRMQMLCRNRALETSLRTWEEKQRRNSVSPAGDRSRDHGPSSTTSQDDDRSFSSVLMSDKEMTLLLNFIEVVSTLVKWVKLLIISHPSLEADLYSIATRCGTCLENLHPNGKILEGLELRMQLTDLVSAARQLYEETCILLRDKAHHLKLREDLESKLSAALANMDSELRKCTKTESPDGPVLQFFYFFFYQTERKNQRKGLFWMKFRSPATGVGASTSSSSTTSVSNWSVQEVAAWLEAMQMHEYVENFVKHDVRGRELLTLARRDLKDLGITKVGHVKRLLQAVKELSS